MRCSDLAERRVGLLGFGREGRSTHAALQRAGGACVTIFDDGPAASAPGVPALAGDAALAALPGLDVLVASPGVPPRHPLLVAGIERCLTITTATNLFLAECAHEDIPVVLVTGSKGKSTTSSLLHAALGCGDRESALVGNVGVPALDELEDILARRPVVIHETSSYQAARLSHSSEIAVITELFPEHLDWHGTAEAYFSDKLRVAALQAPEALTISNGSNAELARRAPLGPARQEAFAVPGGVDFRDGMFLRRGESLFTDGDMRLRGLHNRRNACAVLATAAALSLPDEAVRLALARFEGLPHRLERVGIFGGRCWINDSISTAPEAGVAALEAHSGEARALIAGGQDRGYDFTPLARAVAAHGLGHVALLPPSGEALGRALRAAGHVGVLRESPDLADAVAWMASEAPRGCTIIFSPSSPSYGAFRNFEERGARFRELVTALGA